MTDCIFCSSPTNYYDSRGECEAGEEHFDPQAEWESEVHELREIQLNLLDYDVTDPDELRSIHHRIESIRYEELKQELRKKLLLLQNETGVTVYDGTYSEKEIPTLDRQDYGDVEVLYGEQYDGFAVVDSETEEVISQ